MDNMLNEIEIKPINVGKKTLSMSISEKAFLNIASLFSPETNSLPMRGIHPCTQMGINGYAWTLHAKSYVRINGDKKEKRYFIFGACGDSSFGESPWYFEKKYKGNIKTARIFYDAFLKYITENKFKLIGEKFGI